MSRLQATVQAARELGLGPLTRYALYQVKLRSGWIRGRTPIGAWDEASLTAWLRPGVPGAAEAYAEYRQSLASPAFFFDPFADLRGVLRRTAGKAVNEAVAEADDLRQGWFSVFGRFPLSLRAVSSVEATPFLLLPSKKRPSRPRSLHHPPRQNVFTCGLYVRLTDHRAA